MKIFEDFIRFKSGRIGILLRRIYYSRKFKSCGIGLVISEGVFIDNPKNITIGNNVWIDRNCILITGKIKRENIKFIKEINPNIIGQLDIGDNSHIGINTIIQCHGGVIIGKNFTSSTGVKIYTLSNDVNLSKNGTNNLNKSKNYYIISDVFIGENVWLGINSIVIGAKINDNVFTTPNTVITGIVPENEVLIGNPAIKKRKRFE